MILETTKGHLQVSFWRGYGDFSLFFFRLLAVSLSAISIPLLSAPFSWWPLHWFAWVPFLWAITTQEGRGRLFFAAWGGTLSNILLFYWVVTLMPSFSNVPIYAAIALMLALCLYLSLVWILIALFLPRIRHLFPQGWVFIAPAFLVSFEYLLPQLFPYTQGISHYQVTTIFQLSSITGTYGVSYLLFLSNTLLFHWWERWRLGQTAPRKQLYTFATIMVLVISYGSWRQYSYRLKVAKAKVLKIGLIQSNFQPFDHITYGDATITRIHVDMSHQAVKKGAQWIVWSEGEYRWPISTPSAQKHLYLLAQKIGHPLLVGAIGMKLNEKKQLRYYNHALHADPKHGLGKIYSKMLS